MYDAIHVCFVGFVESFRATVFVNTGPDKNGWNLGKTANWREVFGDKPSKWFLPIYTA